MTSTHRSILVADHHKRIFVCRTIDRATGETAFHKLASTWDALRPFFDALPRPALVFIEACRSWEWVSDLCEDLGIDFQLIDPAKMPEISRSRSKTDRNDVEAMVARLLHTGVLPTSYRASREERNLRLLTRRLTTLREAALVLESHLAELDQARTVTAGFADSYRP
jgi:transposase